MRGKRKAGGELKKFVEPLHGAFINTHQKLKIVQLVVSNSTMKFDVQLLEEATCATRTRRASSSYTR
jgi:hypothetical protein